MTSQPSRLQCPCCGSYVLGTRGAGEVCGVCLWVDVSVDDVQRGLYSFLRSPDDYWSTIRRAIAVGGDIDTTAPRPPMRLRPAIALEQPTVSIG